MRESYPSDITREQFEFIKQDLENANKTTRPRKIDLYEVFCAILYLLKNACTWRSLPHDFPDYRHVYYYYKVWTKKDDKGFSVLDYVQAKLTELYRYEARKNPMPTMLIVDSKTIQNADTAGEKGYEEKKKKQELRFI
jgi:transposase